MDKKITDLGNWRKTKSDENTQKLNEKINQINEEVMYDINFSIKKTIDFLIKQKGLSPMDAECKVMTHLNKLVMTYTMQGGNT